MLSLDLFNTKYERELQEGAVDNLEARRIDDLNMRMLDLLDRAREPAYRKNPGALAGLKAQFQKIKSERDSYFKINPATGMDPTGSIGTVKGALDELGIPGNVPVEKIPGKEELLKGRGRTYYEDQKKNSEPVDEYISMGSDKNYQEVEPYKNYRIYVRRKPFGTTGMYTAHTEIDRKEFMGKGSSQEEAVQAIRDRIDFVLNAQRKVTGSSTIDFNVKFATDLLADPKQTFYAKLENINGEPKLIIAGADIASDPELLAAGDFKRSALRNQVDDSGRATPLPGIPLTAKGLRSGDWIANGRYTVGKETQDRDGNRVFDLTYHSTAHTKSDKLRLNQPAFTLGTAREVDEHGGGIGPRQHWQDLMQEGQPLELINRYLAIDAENDVDAVRQAIQAISRDPNVSDASKIRLLGQLGMIIRRYRLPIGRAYYQFMQQYMEEQSVNETVTDVRPLWADVYRRLAPKIERHRDSFLAGQLYDELENIAELHGAEGEFKRMMNGARNRAHMEYDTNPGGFQNWFWFLPFEDNDVAEMDKSQPSQERHGDRPLGAKCTTATPVAARKVVKDLDMDLDQAFAKQKPVKKKGMTENTDDIKKRMSKLEALALAANRAGDDAKCKMYQQKIQSLKQKLSQSIDEEFGDSPVAGAITRRILSQRLDLLKQYGPELVGAAVDDVADYVGDVDEIGSSDVSGWVAQVERMLRENPPEAFAEGSQDFNKVEPYYVCLAGKPVKKFDYYQDARRFHDNWKQKLNREGNKAKADKVTLMPVIDEGMKKSAAATALAACIAAGGTLSGCATNPSVGGAIGTVRDVGTAAKTASTMTRAGVQDELGQELRNFIRAQGGDPGGQNLSLLYKLQKRLQGQKDSQPINEVKDTQAVEQAILKRIMVAHRDMLVRYGPEKIMTAASDVAYNVGDIGEIGSSDISGWVKQVEQILGVNA